VSARGRERPRRRNRRPTPASAYTASKWGLRGLTRAAAIEFGPDRIRVNGGILAGINGGID
jgi:NAD(P)-dependent dehydrogenase (short-subunit alcohol dehydrogenase family)